MNMIFKPGILMNVYNLLSAFSLLPKEAMINNLSIALLQTYIYSTLIFSTLLFTLNSTFNPFIYYLRCNPILPAPLARIIYLGKIRYWSRDRPRPVKIIYMRHLKRMICS